MGVFYIMISKYIYINYSKLKINRFSKFCIDGFENYMEFCFGFTEILSELAKNGTLSYNFRDFISGRTE